jgi:hypothetical protein
MPSMAIVWGNGFSKDLAYGAPGEVLGTRDGRALRLTTAEIF